VICLDVARAAQRHPQAVDALRARLAAVRGAHADLDRAAARLDARLADAHDAHGGRRLAQAIATTLAGALLVQDAPGGVAGAYCASRLGDDAAAGAAFGTLRDAPAAATVLQRALCEVDPG
jgi:putative acyl-CoA dehydrogenase